MSEMPQNLSRIVTKQALLDKQMTERARYSIDQLSVDRSAIGLHSNKQVYTNETLMNDTMNDTSRGVGGYQSQHVKLRQKVPGLKLPSLDF